MTDVIHLLPDAVANQIAAGEVVERPASVVKELMENSIDAGATEIRVVIKEAGRALIEVSDNGKGMSMTDARMAFERHATSKISSAQDLYALHTMGFRGEALASIVAVSQVEVRTRREEDEMGTLLRLEGSVLMEQEPTLCDRGCKISVKNLFFNVVARRRFLKSNATEFNHILTIFNRIAIVYPQISFLLIHNDVEVYRLQETSSMQRIIDIFGKKMRTQLLPVNTETTLGRIQGYVGRPECATKHGANQFFFINGRYMRHPSFHKAVLMAYERMLPVGQQPCYFITFDVDPSTVDINIHPQKTEVKFENEKPLWAILIASVREALGKFNVVPDIDFDNAADLNRMPLPPKDSNAVRQPETGATPGYNPFRQTKQTSYRRENVDWESLYKGFESRRGEDSPAPPREQMLNLKVDTSEEFTAEEEKKNTALKEFLQFRGRFLVTTVRSGLMVIDQKRAHERVLYEKYKKAYRMQNHPSQRLMFPVSLELNEQENAQIKRLLPELRALGFELSERESRLWRITSVPIETINEQIERIVRDLISAVEGELDAEQLQNKVALHLAKANAIEYGRKMSSDELNMLVSGLFACENCNNTPDGKIIMKVLSETDLSNLF